MFSRFMDLRLRLQIAVTFGLILVAAIVALVGAVEFRASEDATRLAQLYAAETAGKHAREVARRIDRAFDAALSIAAEGETQLKGAAIDRAELAANLETVLEQYPDFFGAWAQYATGVFPDDGKFVNAPNHDNRGRFVGYYVREDGAVRVEEQDPTEDYFKEDYYTVPEQQRGPALIEPYEEDLADGSKVLMTTAAIPVLAGRSVRGVAGVDLTLADMADMVSGIRVYGSGYAVLVTESGNIVGYRDDSLLGKPITDIGLDARLISAIGSDNSVSIRADRRPGHVSGGGAGDVRPSRHAVDIDPGRAS